MGESHDAKQELGETKARNKEWRHSDSPQDVFGWPTGSGSTTFVSGGQSHMGAQNAANDSKMAGGKYGETPKKEYSFGDHDPAQNRYAPARDQVDSNIGNGAQNSTNRTMFGNVLPAPTQWLLPNGMIDSCPNFTPVTFRDWRHEVKLWKMHKLERTRRE